MSDAMPATLDPQQTRDLRENNPRLRLIDVRTPGEFAAAHIPGSHNVPLDVLRRYHEQIAVAHEDPIVLLCATGNRAHQARSVLETAGQGQFSVLAGGVTAWQQHDGPMKHGSGTWAMERQVRLVAGVLVLTSVVASTVHAPLKWIAGFIGGGLTFAAVTDTCALSRVLGLLPHNRTRPCDARTMLAALTGGQTPADSPSR